MKPLLNSGGLSRYISPGSNFYGYVNASWIDKADIPEYTYTTGVSEEIEQRIDKQLQKLFQQFVKEKNKKYECITTLYKSALDYRDRSESIELLQDMLQRIQEIDTKEDVGILMGEFTKYNIESFLNLYGTYILENNKKYTYTFGSGSLGIHESYYQKTILDRKKHFQEYKQFVKTLAQLFQMPSLQCIVPFEKVLAKSILSHEEELRKKGSSLETTYSAIPWEEFFTAFGIPHWRQEVFYIESPVWIETLNTLFQDIEIDFWKIYLSYQLILHSLPYLPNPYSYHYYLFFKKQLNGQPERMPVPLFATYVVESWLTPVVNKVYIEHCFPKERKDHVISLMDDLIEGAIEQLKANTWLNKKTIEKAVEKVKRMRHFIAYPHKFSEHFDVPELDEHNLFKNILSLGEWYTQYGLDRLGKPMPEVDVFNESIFAVNAYYYSESNQMVIPAGTIQEPFFHEKAPMGWNYGGLGCIIAHEMTHAFDDDGKDIDPEGYERTWWTKGDIDAYYEKTKDLIRLFNNQKIVPLKVSGRKTLDENIADIGGMSVALVALHNALQKTCATEKEKKEAYKQFFMAYAVSWRFKDRKQRRFQSLFMDAHASSILRVNLVISQFQEWYDAFNIREKDPLYVPPEKRISIF